MKPTVTRKLARRKRRLQRRLDKTKLGDCSKPMFSARNIDYQLSDRYRGLSHGGIGAIHLLARHLGLIDAIDDRLHLLKIHLPFHESDHVLNLQAGVPVVGVEPVPTDLLPARVGAALLTAAATKSESGCPDPPRHQERPRREARVTWDDQ